MNETKKSETTDVNTNLETDENYDVVKELEECLSSMSIAYILATF